MILETMELSTDQLIVKENSVSATELPLVDKYLILQLSLSKRALNEETVNTHL